MVSQLISGAGRYAPSPSGPLHVGNLRTAVAAWVFARATGRKFYLRIDDIDPQRNGFADQQISDLEKIGLDWDGPVVFQSKHDEFYQEALEVLSQQGDLFECYCSRKDIRQAASAPHATLGLYPGTCFGVSSEQCVTQREKLRQTGRVPALRLAAPWLQNMADPGKGTWTISDLFVGKFTGPVDAFVLRRNDGGPAYNLASVVDDLRMGVDQIIRGADLLGSSPGQAYLGHQLTKGQFGNQFRTDDIKFGHLPLVVNEQGQRLAKRDGAVTLSSLQDLGWSITDITRSICSSLSDKNIHTPGELLANFNPNNIPKVPYLFIETKGFVAVNPSTEVLPFSFR